MKVRNGFVSNSSSSSFCIYGTSLDLSEMIEKVKEINLISEEQADELEENDEWYEYDEWYELGKIIGEKTDLEVYQDGENDTIWIGRSWSSIEDEETGRQFKDGVELELEKVFGAGFECETYDEVLYS